MHGSALLSDYQDPLGALVHNGAATLIKRQRPHQLELLALC